VSLDELRSDRKIPWAAPQVCPKELEPRHVLAGRTDMPGGVPIELAVARWTARERVEALLGFVTETGLPIPEQPTALPAVRREEIRVVCWTAVMPAPREAVELAD